MEIMLKNKCCLYVIISIRFFPITICNLLIEFPSYYMKEKTKKWSTQHFVGNKRDRYCCVSYKMQWVLLVPEYLTLISEDAIISVCYYLCISVWGPGVD